MKPELRTSRKRINQIQGQLNAKKNGKANALKLDTDNAAPSLKESYES